MLGPIDNSDILDSAQQLKPALLELDQYHLLPQAAWNLLHSW
jgi:hypothetical protein